MSPVRKKTHAMHRGYDERSPSCPASHARWADALYALTPETNSFCLHRLANCTNGTSRTENYRGALRRPGGHQARQNPWQYLSRLFVSVSSTGAATFLMYWDRAHKVPTTRAAEHW